MRTEPNAKSSGGRLRLPRWLGTVAKWSLFAVVVVFIGRRAWQLWEQGDFTGLQLRPTWLVLSGGAYALGWLPSVWFWRRLMQSLGASVSWHETARAYYCGHLGKYVPGKAMVLVIRAGMMRRAGVSLAAGALTATYETLFLMGVALLVAATLSPLFFRSIPWSDLPAGWALLRDHAWAVPPAVLVLTAAALPVVSRLLSVLAWKATPPDFRENRPVGVGLIPTRLLYEGVVAFALAWACHGLSLGLAVRSLGAAWRWADWPVWTAAVSLATSVGFLAVFAPGGLGVREGLLIETLRATVGGPRAVLAAVLLRAVWLVTEILLAGGLYYAGSRNDSAADPPDSRSNKPTRRP